MILPPTMPSIGKEKPECSPLQFLFNNELKRIDSAVEQEKEIKCIRIRKEEIKNSQYSQMI